MSVPRTIGLLGGMSPESSIEYERIINAEVQRSLGGVHSANLLLHLADATASAVREAGLREIGLLGTRYTMEEAFYRVRLERHGLTVLVPDEPGRKVIHEVIYGELVRGVVNPASKARYLEVIDGLLARGARGIIAGCTEIELLLPPEDVSVPYFPTTRLHARAAARWSLGDEGRMMASEGESTGGSDTRG